eukprot:gene1662-432_t
MKILVILSLFVLLCQCKNFDIKTQLIAGGTKATSGQIPYAVALTENDEITHFCGGSLINKDWILTAAHCFDNGTQIADVTFILGRLNLPSQTGGIALTAKRAIIHPSYDERNTETNYDIALVELSTSVAETAEIKYITPHQGDDVPVGTNVVVSGWGTTPATPKDSSPDLLTVSVPIQHVADCDLTDAAGSVRYCAYSSSPIKDSCGGDSGGPLVWTSNNVDYLIGVVSYGSSGACGNVDTFGVYTKVKSYISWMKQYVPFPVTSSVTCFGISASDQSVCSGRGTCTATDICSCNKGYTGNQCQTLVVDFGSASSMSFSIFGILMFMAIIYLFN